MASPLLQLLARWLVLALGVTLAALIVPGIHCDGGGALAAVVVMLAVLNFLLKPVLVLFTLPFIVLTMGLGLVLINALLFYWAGHLVGGFHVAGFRSAVLGSLVVSGSNWVASRLMRKRQPPAPRRNDDVIDI